MISIIVTAIIVIVVIAVVICGGVVGMGVFAHTQSRNGDAV